MAFDTYTLCFQNLTKVAKLDQEGQIEYTQLVRMVIKSDPKIDLPEVMSHTQMRHQRTEHTVLSQGKPV